MKSQKLLIEIFARTMSKEKCNA